jgi:hypothetical protein
MDIPVAANVLGTLGAVCWSVQVSYTSPYQYPHVCSSYMYQLIPQIIINYRRHNATGLQPTMMMLWAWAGVPLAVYNIAEGFNIALRIQPQILTLLSLVTWIQCFYYERVPLPRSGHNMKRPDTCRNGQLSVPLQLLFPSYA